MNDDASFRFLFFLPNTRVLSKREIENLPDDKKYYAEVAGKDGIWLEIECPDRSCLDTEGRITLPVNPPAGKGFFLNLFCPENSCEIVQVTDLT
jgi:hypothetical protein